MIQPCSPPVRWLTTPSSIFSLQKNELPYWELSVKKAGSLYRQYNNHPENHIADNHVWQMTLRILTMASFATYNEIPEAALWANYCYNVWVARMPWTQQGRCLAQRRFLLHGKYPHADRGALFLQPPLRFRFLPGSMVQEQYPVCHLPAASILKIGRQRKFTPKRITA